MWVIASTNCILYLSHPDYLLPRGSGYFSSQTFSLSIPHILNRSHTSYPLAYEDGQTECSETLAFKLQTAGNNPEETTRLTILSKIYVAYIVYMLSSSLLSKSLKIKIYTTIILSVFLDGCETWSLTLREERRLRLFENRESMRVFGLKRDEVTGIGKSYIMRS
jgi:hypothetical protein